MPDPIQNTGDPNSTANFDSWYANARSVIMNLNTADDTLTKFISDQFSQTGDKSADSEAKRNALELLISRRTQVTTAISNILRMIGDTARQVISNMRS